MSSATKFWELWLDYGAKGLDEMEAGHPPAKSETAAKKKNIQGCWECEEFETCEKLDFLKPIHEDAHLKNLRKMRKQGVDKLLEGNRYW